MNLIKICWKKHPTKPLVANCKKNQKTSKLQTQTFSNTVVCIEIITCGLAFLFFSTFIVQNGMDYKTENK